MIGKILSLGFKHQDDVAICELGDDGHLTRIVANALHVSHAMLCHDLRHIWRLSGGRCPGESLIKRVDVGGFARPAVAS